MAPITALGFALILLEIERGKVHHHSVNFDDRVGGNVNRCDLK